MRSTPDAPYCDTPETRTHKDITANDFVPQRMKPSTGIHLGCPVQRVLQGTHRIRRSRSTRGGTSHLHGTHRAPHQHQHASTTRSGPSLTAGCVVLPARSVLRPPPTPSRPTTTSRDTGYRRPASRRRNPRRSPGRGGPPQFPSPLSERSTPHTPEGSWRLRFRFFTASMAFTVISAARLPLLPTLTGRTSNDAAGFASCCGPLSCSPLQGFRHWASTRPVSRPSRQSATGPPDSYPDRTHTGKRRRATNSKSPTQATSCSAGRTKFRG